MCGICGVVRNEGVSEQELGAMTRMITHRGPDDEGFYINGKAGLGIRRLSIIDVEGGHQPISNEDGSIWVVFNGEIYNYGSLRQDLQGKGHLFKTRTDTEAIVHLYEEYGERCVEKLSGMFAFAIWDEDRQMLFLARDRIGQKPLFYARVGDAFLFASEIKAILATGAITPEIDFESVHHYLSLRFIPAPRTMFCHIQKLPPAHYLVYQHGNIDLKRYWDLSFTDKYSFSEDEFLEGLREKLAQSVQSHLMSDVPLGAFLSGGLDSSMIVALSANEQSQRLKTFTIGVKEQDYNEAPYARMVADAYNTDHIEEYVQTDLIGMLPKIVWHMDEPSDPIAACMFNAAQLASRHVKVVLGGDGGDEIFAGFDRYTGFNYIRLYSQIPSLFRQGIFGPLLNRASDSFTYKSFTQKIRWVHQLASIDGVGRQYAEATCFFRFNHQNKQDLYHKSLWNDVGHLDSTTIISDQYERANASNAIDRMLYTDLMTRLPEHSLMLTDRMTMAHSLEARAPFLDHELVEFMAAFPSHLKTKGRKTKVILRELAKGYLDQKIVNRDKQGFSFPIAYWFQSDLNSFLNKYLLSSHFVREGVFRKENVRTLIDDHRAQKVDNHVRLWMLLNLQVWHDIFIEGKSPDTVGESIRRAL